MLMLHNLYGGCLWLLQTGGIRICGGIFGQTWYRILYIAHGIAQIIVRQLDNNSCSRQQIAGIGRTQSWRRAQCLTVARCAGYGIGHSFQDGPVTVCKESRELPAAH